MKAVYNTYTENCLTYPDSAAIFYYTSARTRTPLVYNLQYYVILYKPK